MNETGAPDTLANDAAAEPLTPYPDLAGLPVHDVDDLRVGQVFAVLSEADSGLIRFLDVELDADVRHVLVPVGHVRLEEKLGRTRLRLRAARLDDLENVPTHAPDRPWDDAGYAREIATAYGRFFRGDHYYAHPAYDHDVLFAGPHPIVYDGKEEAVGTSLASLAPGDQRIAPGEPDVRGWPLYDAEGMFVGVVAGLLIDPVAERVRYAVVELEDGTQRLLPIGYVELASKPERVIVPGLTLADLHVLPEYNGTIPTRKKEEALLESIERLLDARNPFNRVEFSKRIILPK